MGRSASRQVLFYLDANVILSQLEPGRRTAVNKAFFDELAKKRNWKILVSSFAAAEVIETLIESAYIARQCASGYVAREVLRQQHSRETTSEERKRAGMKMEDFLKRWGDHIVIVECEAEAWTLAVKMVREFDVSAPDAVHVATASRAHADAFLTEDEPLVLRLSAVKDGGFSPEIVHCCDRDGVRDFLRKLDRLERRKGPVPPATGLTRGAMAVVDFIRQVAGHKDE